MPKALQKPPPHPPHQGISPTQVWDMRKRLGVGERMWSMELASRWTREAQCNGKPELKGGKRTCNDNEQSSPNWQMSFIVKF